MSKLGMKLNSNFKKDSIGKTELEQSIEDANKGKFSHSYANVDEFRKHLIYENEHN